jgi:hypothetical protein
VLPWQGVDDDVVDAILALPLQGQVRGNLDGVGKSPHRYSWTIARIITGFERYGHARRGGLPHQPHVGGRQPEGGVHQVGHLPFEPLGFAGHRLERGNRRRTVALVAICTLASLVGSMMPVLAHPLGVDPAVVSAPFVTTIVDAAGLLVYFLIARAVLRI